MHRRLISQAWRLLYQIDCQAEAQCHAQERIPRGWQRAFQRYDRRVSARYTSTHHVAKG